MVQELEEADKVADQRLLLLPLLVAAGMEWGQERRLLGKEVVLQLPVPLGLHEGRRGGGGGERGRREGYEGEEMGDNKENRVSGKAGGTHINTITQHTYDMQI